MIAWSLVLGALGVLVTGTLVARFGREPAPWGQTQCWLVGITGLLPAWLVAFLALLGTAPQEGRPELSQSIPWIFSSSAALLGLLATDAAVRRLRESGREQRPATYWLIGLLTFLPAWAIALLGLALARH